MSDSGEGSPAAGGSGRDLAEAADRRLTFRDRLVLAVGIFLFGWLVRLLVASYRVEIAAGREHLERIVAGGGPAVVAGWHEASLAGTPFVMRHLLRRGLGLTLLVSSSRDGEAMARMAARIGVSVVRGSTSRGALQGLRRLHHALTRTGDCVAVAPDGPRGPARVCQPGAVLLAQLGGAPLLPFGFAADRAWRLGSWDRMLVPKPFARIAVAVGEPLTVARSSERSALEAETARLAAALDALTERAERAASG